MLRDLIYQTYRSQFSQLSESKRFHFVSRLNLTTSDPWARSELDNLKAWFLGGSDELAYSTRLKEISSSLPDPLHLNASAQRMPIFDKYPWLFGYELQLFQVMHAEAQYDVNIRPLLQVPVDDIDIQIQKLTANPEVLAILSTYLVDIYYLHTRIIRSDEASLLDYSILAQALDHKFATTEKARLNIYLLTHCIIGETLFYQRSIPNGKRKYYSDIAMLLETIAAREWDNLTLDNKLEIALCFQITNHQSDLSSKAILESEVNFDSSLGLITDPKMPHKNNPEWSEHRNILYLLVANNTR